MFVLVVLVLEQGPNLKHRPRDVNYGLYHKQ